MANYLTPYEDDTTRFRALDMNAPLLQLDTAVKEHKDEAEAQVVSLRDAAVVIAYPNGAGPEPEEKFNIVMATGFEFASNLAGSLYYAATPPNDNATVTFEKNGAQFGSMIVSAGSTVATFSGTTNFTAGDRLTVVFPDAQDPAWAGVSISLKGKKVL